MRTVKDVKILQMMPAQGWYAEYAEPTGNVAVPLAGWALVEFTIQGERQRAVWGLAPDAGTVDYPELAPSFQRYFTASTPPEHLRTNPGQPNKGRKSFIGSSAATKSAQKNAKKASGNPRSTKKMSK